MTDRPPKKVVKAKKVKNPKAWFRSPLFKALLAIFLIGFIAASGTFLYFYVQYSKMIDRKLSGEIFKNTAKIYATPYRIYPGQKIAPEAVVGRLQRAGFETSEKGTTSDGVYTVSPNQITLRPNQGEPLRLDFQKGVLTRIIKPAAQSDAEEAWLPPELVTNLFDESREKRRVVQFKEIPKVLHDALIASEDRRFYSHHGVDPVRLIGAVVDSIRNSHRVEGTSTLTQQVARNFFNMTTLDRSASRKIREAFIALILEQRLTKEQIFTMYANEVYLGSRGSFSIQGFGEGAAAYFDKDIGQLTLPEAAMLVGIIPAANTYSPSRWPERAKARRNVVLASMHSVGSINDKEYEAAKNAEIKVAEIKLDGSDAPYLIDYIREQLLKDYSDEALINSNLKVYTSLDPDLQKAAVAAVAKGLKEPLDEIARRKKRQKVSDNLPDPQAGLIVLDPHTGEIKAMVGGSDYGVSQYNRITQAFRQPGSIFKPLVYATAFEAAFDGMEAAKEPEKSDAPGTAEAAPAPDPLPQINRAGLITPITQFVDEPTTFKYEGDREYTPGNFKMEFYGLVTAKFALQHSLNVPTIKVAEQIGYDRVAEFAKRAGLNEKIKGYPSIGLGAFEVTPIEMARAYTMFANEGKRMEPHALVRVASGDGKAVKNYTYEPQQVIRPELAYLMTNLMEGVLANGTAVGVRTRGFMLPAAGKTGTSRDGWFAGYTKDLLAIAWVGYDDNRDLDIEGAHSALPIWTDFMLRAYQLYPARDVDAMNFEPPPGIQFVKLDKESLLLATPSCPDTFEEAFIAGTAPTSYCPLHGFHVPGIDTNSTVGRALNSIGHWFGSLVHH